MFLIGRTLIPGVFIVHEQARDAAVLAVLGGGVGAYQQDHPLRDRRERGPDLLAVDHVVIAVAQRAALQRRQVAARSRLGVAGAPLVLAVEDVGDEALLLGLAAVLDQRRADPREPHEARAERRRSALGHLLLQDHLLHDACRRRRRPRAAKRSRPSASRAPCAARRACPCTGRFSSRNARTSSRNASSSGPKSKSITDLRGARCARSDDRRRRTAAAPTWNV